MTRRELAEHTIENIAVLLVDSPDISESSRSLKGSNNKAYV